MDRLISQVSFNSHGLVCAVVTDYRNGSLLMVAWMNKETLRETLQSNRMVYWSRSRSERWLKGETSGHFQMVKNVQIDCDGDTLHFEVDQIGAACHEGYRSCFFRSRVADEWVITSEK